jgi:putative salt-induced outer membrane protein YdiY
MCALVRTWLLVLLGLGVFATTAHAQTPTPAPPPEPPPIREGSAEFAFVGTSGNASTQTMGLGGEYIYRPAPWELKGRVKYVRNRSDDELKAESILFTFRAQRSLRPRLAAYGEYEYERDRFAGILNRNAVEGGIAYTWIDRSPHNLTIDAGLGYVHEGRLIGNDVSTATLTTGAAYVLKLSETSEVREEGRFEFSLSESSDWRYANALSVTAKLATIFSLKAANTVRYVHEPVDGFEATDVTTAVALVVKF